MKLDRVTLTGADDTVEVEEILEMAETYPFVEWGILMGAGEHGGGRFPSWKWIDKLVEEVGPKVNLCAHLCGKPVMDLLAYGFLPTYVTKVFQRIQVNTHGSPIAEVKAFKNALSLLKATKRHFIFQCDGPNDDLIKEWVKTGIGEPLFDTSSGAGMTPEQYGEEWPKVWEGVYCGYAGGLGPLNVVYQIEDPIKKAVGDGHIWIDMETKIRTGGAFSMKKCEDVLKKMKPYITA